MKKSSQPETSKTVNEKRMLSEAEAMTYCGLGRTSIRRLGNELDCIVRYGRRILYDRRSLDAFIDSQK